MMKKYACVFTVIFMLLSGCMQAFAFDESSIYTDFRLYRAKVYVCDTDNNEIVLKGVSPMNVMDGIAGARDIEYRAIGVNTSALYEKNGNRVSLDVINGYLLDLDAKVLVGRCGYGYRVLYLEIQNG